MNPLVPEDICNALHGKTVMIKLYGNKKFISCIMLCQKEKGYSIKPLHKINKSNDGYQHWVNLDGNLVCYNREEGNFRDDFINSRFDLFRKTMNNKVPKFDFNLAKIHELGIRGFGTGTLCPFK